MGLFEGILSSEESLFVEPMALDFDYQPQLVPHRENHKQTIARCIKPLFSKRTGKNLFIVGKPGLGKTVCIKHVLREVNQQTDEILTIYINCWKNDTPFKIILKICESLGFTWTHNKSYDELLKKVLEIINKKSCVLVLDEIDRLNDLKVVYTLLEDVFRQTMILITNHPSFIVNLDSRIKSRLAADSLEFEAYSQSQIFDILKQRKDFAFVKGVWNSEAFDLIVRKTFESGDIRKGLSLLKSSGEVAEFESSREILLKHVEKALDKLEIRVKKISEESEDILKLIKAHKNKSVKDLFEVYSAQGGNKSYRTFHRRLKELESSKLISIKEINKGFEEGRTNIVEVC